METDRLKQIKFEIYIIVWRPLRRRIIENHYNTYKNNTPERQKLDSVQMHLFQIQYGGQKLTQRVKIGNSLLCFNAHQ